MPAPHADGMVLPPLSREMVADRAHESDPIQRASDSFHSATKAWAITPALPQRVLRKEGEIVGGRYVIRGVLGLGGMGAVYRVLDRVKGLERALKIAASDYYQNEAGLLRFKQEFLAMASLKHPNLPTVLHYSLTDKGEPFLVMELVEGRILEKGQRLQLPEFYNLFVQFARALDFIHQRGYLHRDIKPANTMIFPAANPSEPERLVLLDFGLMERLGAVSEKVVCGTPEYLAPEVLKARILDPRTDIYSLGITAFQLLTGHLPFQHRDVKELFLMHERGKRPRVGESNYEVQAALDQLIFEMMSADPIDRPASCDEVLRRLSGQTECVLQSDLESRRAYLHLTDLVGRETELKQLRSGLERAEAGRKNCLLVCGRTGRGKSRLLQEVQHEALMRGFFVGGAVCREEYRSAYQALRIVLQGLLPAAFEVDKLPVRTRALHRLLPTNLAPTAEPEEAEISPQAARGHVIQEMAEWVQQLAQVRPILLLVDDLQWCDESSLLVLRALVSQMSESRFLLVGAFRSEEVADGSDLGQWRFDEGTETFELPAFNEIQVAEFLDRLLGANALRGSARNLVNLAEGTPFFIIQTLSDMIERGVLMRFGGIWQTVSSEIDLPSSLRPILERRIHRLNGLAREIAIQLAIAGGNLVTRDVVALCDQTEEAALVAIENLLAHNLATLKGDTISLVHDRIREIVYEQTPITDRRRYHQRLAVLLEQRLPEGSPNRAASLGHHFARGTDVVRGLDYLESAGMAAMDDEQIEVAKNLLLEVENLLEKLDGLPKKEDRLFAVKFTLAKMAVTTDYIALSDRAEWVYKRLLERSIFRSIHRWGTVLPNPIPFCLCLVTGLMRLFSKEKRKAWHEARNDLRLLCTTIVSSANGYGCGGRFTTARATAKRLRVFGFSRRNLARALEPLAMGASMANEDPPRTIVKAVQRTRRTLQTASTCQLDAHFQRLYVGGTHFLEALAYGWDQHPLFHKSIQKCLECADQNKSPLLLHYAYHAAVEFHVRAGNVFAADTAEEKFRQSVLRVGGRAPQREHLVDMSMGRIDLAAGRIDKAARRAERLMRSGSGYHTEGFGRFLRSGINLAWQKMDEAMKCAETALTWARNDEVRGGFFEFLVLGLMADIEIACRHPSQALELIGQMEARSNPKLHFTAYDAVEIMHRRALAMESVNQDEALALAQMALREAISVNCPRQIAEAHVTIATVMGHESKAQENAVLKHRREAAQLFQRLGNNFQAERLISARL